MDYYQILKDICVELQNNVFDCGDGITVIKVPFSDSDSSSIKTNISSAEDATFGIKIYVAENIPLTKHNIAHTLEIMLNFVDLNFKTETEKQNFISHLKSLYQE